MHESQAGSIANGAGAEERGRRKEDGGRRTEECLSLVVSVLLRGGQVPFDPFHEFVGVGLPHQLLGAVVDPSMGGYVQRLGDLPQESQQHRQLLLREQVHLQVQVGAALGIVDSCGSG